MAVGGLREEGVDVQNEDVVGRLDEDEAVVRDDELEGEDHVQAEEGREVGAEEDRV